MKHLKKPLVLFTFAIVLGARAFADFDITGSSTTAQTLGSGSGQTGVIEAGASLTIGGGTNAVTISGNNATFTNLGTLSQTGSARAIRDNSGVTNLIVNNGSTTNSTALMQAADSDVIQMNKTPASITLNNYGTMTSLNASKGGAQAIDFGAILSGTNIINNFSTGILQARDADAVRPGVNGQVFNDGIIRATNTTDTSDDGIDAQSNSGISIVNANTNLSTSPNLIEGARHGITGGAVDANTAFTMSITNNSNGTIRGNNGSGVNIDGFNNKEVITIVNAGVITGNGVTADGDGVDVDGVVNLTNSGTIRSLNSLNDVSEGVTVGGGTINNTGTIRGSISTTSGNTGVGRGITIAGVDKDSNKNPIPPQAPYAASTITNSGLIQGDSDSAIAFTSGQASGFLMTITNQVGGTIEGGGAAAAAIQGGVDNLVINNSGTIKADTSGKAIAMGTGSNTLNIFGGSILGDIDGGSGGSNSLVVDPGAGHTFTYAGTITHFATAQIKSGTFSLAGTMTAGGTTVNGGTLAGTGTVNGLVTITTGGVLSPGNSAGKLTLQTGVNLSSGGKFLWQLTSLKDDATGTAGTDFDQILLTGGNVTLGGTSLLTLDFSLLGAGSDPNSADTYWDSNHSWTIIDGTGSATNAGSTNFSQITNATYADGFFTTSSDSAGNTVLNFQAVPEPGSAALFVFGTLGLLARRRRA